MATKPETQGHGSGIARTLLVPAAISAVGSAVGFLLAKRQKVREAAPKLREAVSDLSVREAVPKLREAVSDLSVPGVPEGGVGELTGDLRGKLDEVLGKEPAADAGRAASSKTSIDHSELERRRRERQERRNQRRQRSRR